MANELSVFCYQRAPSFRGTGYRRVSLSGFGGQVAHEESSMLVSLGETLESIFEKQIPPFHSLCLLPKTIHLQRLRSASTTPQADYRALVEDVCTKIASPRSLQTLATRSDAGVTQGPLRGFQKTTRAWSKANGCFHQNGKLL